MGTHSNTTNRGVWLGIILVAIGGYFLLRNFNMIPSFIPYYFFGWEMVFVIIGGALLATGRRAGVIFLAIGAISLLPEMFGWYNISLFDWWPAILIAIGVYVMVERKNHSTHFENLDHDHVNETAIFGGCEKSIVSQNFKGGKITSVFGGSELNFAEAKMHGNEVIVDVFCLFGGNTLIVPSDWTVVQESTVIFGGYSEQRLTSNRVSDPEKILRVKGLVVFGGGEIKYV